MNFSRITFFYALLVACNADSALTDECLSALQILHLQDTSGSFGDWLASISGFSSELMSKLGDAVGEFEYGVAGFVDKPIPYRGWGDYGNSNWPIDYCYELTAPLSESADIVQEGFKVASSHYGAGGDYPENPLEAMIFGALDTEVGWATESHAPSGRPYKKVLLIVTDDLMNDAPLAQEGINEWNAPRDWINETYSTGGWGSSAFVHSNQIRNLDSNSRALYAELGSLLRAQDFGIALTASESDRLEELTSRFGPYPFPDVVPHPGDNSMSCEHTEYPTLEQTARVLKETQVTPILLLQKAPYADEADFEWTIDYYSNKLMELGVDEPIIGRLEDISTSVDNIVDLLRRVQTNCLSTTSAPDASSEETTADTLETTVPSDVTSLEYFETTVGIVETTAPIEATSHEHDETSAEIVETTAPIEATSHEHDETSAEVVETTELLVEETQYSTVAEESSVPSEADTTEEVEDDDHDEDDDTEEVEDDDHDEDDDTEERDEEEYSTPVGVVAGGGSGKTIAGATAGAAAGLAAAAAAFWKFGGGLLHGTPSVNIDGLEQMETPENPVDREAMEEITMDMFN